MSSDTGEMQAGVISWSRRGTLAAALLGVALLEGTYGCVGTADAESFVDENIGETEDPLTGDLWLTAGDAIYSAANAQVGIGTKNPGTTLDVVGTVRAWDYIVDSQPIDTRYVNEGQLASVSGAMIQDGTIGVADVNTAEVQKRVASSCPAGQSIRAIAADGTVTCQVDSTALEWWSSDFYQIGWDGSNLDPEDYPKLDNLAGAPLAFCAIGRLQHDGVNGGTCEVHWEHTGYDQNGQKLGYWELSLSKWAGGGIGCSAICIKK